MIDASVLQSPINKFGACFAQIAIKSKFFRTSIPSFLFLIQSQKIKISYKFILQYAVLV